MPTYTQTAEPEVKIGGPGPAGASRVAQLEQVRRVAIERGATPAEADAIARDVVQIRGTVAQFLAGTDQGVTYGVAAASTEEPQPIQRMETAGATPAPIPSATPTETGGRQTAPAATTDKDAAFQSALQPLLDQLAGVQDELRKLQAANTALEKSYRDTAFGQEAARISLQGMEAMAEPRANYMSWFARSPRDTQIPLIPEVAALVRGQGIPGFGTIGGNIPTIPNNPQAAAAAFTSAIQNLTSRSIRDFSQQGRDALSVLGQVGGMDPVAEWQARTRAVPTESRLFGSRFI